MNRVAKVNAGWLLSTLLLSVAVVALAAGGMVGVFAGVLAMFAGLRVLIGTTMLAVRSQSHSPSGRFIR